MRLALIAGRSSATNRGLCRALIGDSAWEELTPLSALESLGPGDGALGRFDVLPTLDGIDEGLWTLGVLAARGVHVLNDTAALLATHDKLLTARLLRRHGLPHPATSHVRDGREHPTITGPVVIKPRLGSWGCDVIRCDDSSELGAALAELAAKSWFKEHGALVQELIPPRGYDLRVLVAAGRIVGAIHRIAAAGEWRTNISLGGVRRAVSDPPRSAAALALAAAQATGADLVGVDLLPTSNGEWVVVELNGAVEFTAEYSDWCDVFAEAALLLEGEVLDRRRGQASQVLPGVALIDDAPAA